MIHTYQFFKGFNKGNFNKILTEILIKILRCILLVVPSQYYCKHVIKQLKSETKEVTKLKS